MKFSLCICVSSLFTLIANASPRTAFTFSNGVVGQRPYIGLKNVITAVKAEFFMDIGVFRCDEDGVYFFTFSALSAEDIGFRISLRKNCVSVATGFAPSNGFNAATITCVVQLSKGDLFYPYLEEGSIYESKDARRSYTTFSGFELFPLVSSEWANQADAVNIFQRKLARPSPRVTTANVSATDQSLLADPQDDTLNIVQQEDWKLARKS